MKYFRTIFLLAAMGMLLVPPPGDADIFPINNDITDLRPENQGTHVRRTDTHLWVGLSGFQFLKIGQGARAVAMGDAYTAVADDINAIYWNPAGLTAVRGTAWTANYTKWLVDSEVYSAAVAWNTGTAQGGVLGMSVMSFRPGEILETTIFQPRGTGQTVAAGDLAIGVVYALKLTDKFSFATRVQWIHQTLYTESLSTIGIDVGTLFHTGFKSLRLAMALKNFGPDKKVTETKFFMPLYYNVALAAEFYGEKGDLTYLTITGESAFAADYELRAHVGAEAWFQNIFALRAGYKINYDTDSFSAGAGLKYEIAGDRSLTVDVAYSDMGELFSAPIRVTVGGTF
jgi:hypothetical protein